jgi:phospholipid/cholesterol/gamma-HCH transport system substrate-binding protein
MKILRNTDEWVGLLVVVCVVLFTAAALHAGLLSGWFRPTVSLRVMLPEGGGQGLSAGADIEVLGTRVGTVRRIVVDPSQRVYAEAELDEPAKGFVRRDSQAVIKKSFGIAGAAFLDISRGSGTPLDWHFAVIDAVTERAPTENIGAMIDEVKLKIYPVLDDAGRAMHALAATMEDIAGGRGNIGRLLKDEALIAQIGETLANLKAMTEELNKGISDIRSLASTVSQPDGVPALLRRVDSAMASVQAAARDLAAATPQVPAVTRNLAGTTATLPALLTQAQQTMSELEKLSNQLRHTWPLSGAVAPETRRLSPGEVKP